MKVKVNRQLSDGKYHVNFEVGDFTPDDIYKMSSFGVPTIELKWQTSAGQTVGRVALNKVNKVYVGVFVSEQAAKDYEQGVLAAIRAAMDHLRKSKDEFSSSQEVEL